MAFAILKQFRLIYGSVKQHFREVEQRCGVSGSQLWLLHEIARTPGVGVSELAGRLSIHQSTCSQLVDKLETRGLVSKRRKPEDQRRVGLEVSGSAADVLQAAPGPAEGVLPEALQGLSEEALLRLHAGLADVIGQLKTRDERSVDKPLADL
ncbi:MarR family winged helix-turn-helix transcriptional regulator [Zoogloea sp. LCSB751]|uniref:MarR family winged helix-turn-helix transcriptional regulator n=1 Tax=Zoogloea sp. LCSB751 TaxID=1965277 RepID=UPI001C1FEE8D|nr:MarR family transcriptional regulator [Zoogloea sp. LCSB751]